MIPTMGVGRCCRRLSRHMIEISEAARALLLVGLALIAGFGWMVLRTLRLPTSSPDRLCGAADGAVRGVMLALMAGASLGLTAANDGRPKWPSKAPWR